MVLVAMKKWGEWMRALNRIDWLSLSRPRWFAKTKCMKAKREAM